MFQILPYLWSVGDMKEFIWLTDCVCVSKNSQTSPILTTKLGEPILLGFCRTTQLRDVIIYSGRRLNIFSHFVFTGGSNFPFFHTLWSWLLTQRIVHTRDRAIVTMADYMSYMVYRTAQFSMNCRYGHSYYGRRIENRTQVFKWYHFQWSWVTCNPHFKVTIIFNVK